MTDFLYNKEYGVNVLDSMYLKNPEPALNYINEITQKLIETNDDQKAQLEIKVKLFADFKTIFEYDLDHSVRPEPTGPFGSDRKKREFIRKKQLFQDFTLYLGTVFINYHNAMINAGKIVLLEAGRLVVDYGELYRAAMSDYIRVLLQQPHTIQLVSQSQREQLARDFEKKEQAWNSEYQFFKYRGEIQRRVVPIKNKMRLWQEHACAATFILPSLIEHFLLIQLENTVIGRWLTGIGDEIKAKSVVLTEDEAELYNHFVEMVSEGSGLLYGDKRSNMEKIWKMGVKYRVLPKDKDMKEILCGKSDGTANTIGAVLHSHYAKSMIRPEYLDILNYMFGAQNLNIRNCIAHGNSETYDYLSVEITAVMLQFLQDIGQGVVVYPI